MNKMYMDKVVACNTENNQQMPWDELTLATV